MALPFFFHALCLVPSNLERRLSYGNLLQNVPALLPLLPVRGFDDSPAFFIKLHFEYSQLSRIY
jgi:hypothetical protein